MNQNQQERNYKYNQQRNTRRNPGHQAEAEPLRPSPKNIIIEIAGREEPEPDAIPEELNRFLKAIFGRADMTHTKISNLTRNLPEQMDRLIQFMETTASYAAQAEANSKEILRHQADAGTLDTDEILNAFERIVGKLNQMDNTLSVQGHFMWNKIDRIVNQAEKRLHKAIGTHCIRPSEETPPAPAKTAHSDIKSTLPEAVQPAFNAPEAVLRAMFRGEDDFGYYNAPERASFGNALMEAVDRGKDEAGEICKDIIDRVKGEAPDISDQLHFSVDRECWAAVLRWMGDYVNALPCQKRFKGFLTLWDGIIKGMVFEWEFIDFFDPLKALPFNIAEIDEILEAAEGEATAAAVKRWREIEPQERAKTA